MVILLKSEQGMLIEKDDSPRILDRQPSYTNEQADITKVKSDDDKEVAETIKPAEIKTAAKKKAATKKKKQDDGFREIPIKILTPEEETYETESSSEVY
jgi:hypothetical protein